LSVFAVPRASKAASGWRQFCDRQPTPGELAAMFGSEPSNVAVAYGPASGNLVGLDCDSPSVLAKVRAALDGLGLETWRIQRPPNGSPHDGGGLVLLRSTEPATGRKVGDLEVKASGYSLLPASEHPSGGLYFFAARPPTIATVQPRDLPDLLTLAAARATRQDLEAQLLALGLHRSAKPPDLARRILEGDAATIARYASRSEAEAAAVASLANAGFTFDNVLSLFLASPGAGKFLEKAKRNPQTATRYLERTWTNAVRWILANPSPTRSHALTWRAWALSVPWPGATGAVDRAAFLAHCTLAARSCTQPHGASAREIAELSGVHRATAAKATNRLVGLGLLRLEVPATFNLSARYALPTPRPILTGQEATVSHSGDTRNRECRVESSLGHDLFRRAALGQAGGDVWRALSGQVSEGEVAKVTGRKVRTVHRKLLTMFRLGLVEPLGDKVWQRASCADLDRAAAELGTAGMGERQREKHRAEREGRQRSW
jgi:hypothetical protein